MEESPREPAPPLDSTGTEDLEVAAGDEQLEAKLDRDIWYFMI